ncbi:ATP-binding protein [Streptomyces sp. NPDC002835]
MPSRPSPVSSSASEPAREGHRFTVLLSPTRRGARLARRLTERQLADWQQPSESAEHIVAELAANAVQHGRVPGRDFRLTLLLDVRGVLRIEVTDVCGERLPLMAVAPASGDEVGREGGRGLLIVDALATRWGVELTAEPPVRKTVWATLEPALAPDVAPASSPAD